ncbi:MAG: GNAT family N-acetyltransferase [Spirochaetaceae bacterium]
MIRFEKITLDNYRECIKLDPGVAGSKFVAPNVNSLAIAYVAKDNNVCKPMPYAIYNDDVMVGFILMSLINKDLDNDVKEDTYDIWRFMIDQKFQGKGYGRESLIKAIELIRSFPQGPANTLVLSYDPDNKVGSSLYESVGFKATGEVSEGEICMVLDLTV